jgi:SAM-dependent methyltransferase
MAHPRAPAATEPSCRLCGARLHRTLIDLGPLPLANRTLAPGETDDPPYRLHARMCDTCTLVQVDDVAAPEAIGAPFLSARSAAYQIRTGRYAETMRKRLRLNAGSLVIEVGPNDGTRLPHFQAAGIKVLGIATAPTAVFNTETAMEFAVRHGRADLVVANDMLQHAPDMFDFAAGLASVLRPNGVLGLQVPYLLSLVQKLQFDAFRHDTYTYLSLRVLEHLLRSVGLRVFDAEAVPDHGGSIRVHACRADGPHVARPGLKAMRLAEHFAELDRRDFFTGFSERVAVAQHDLRDFLRTRRTAGRRVAAYGAAARGITLLNSSGITEQEIACVGDSDPAKDGRLLPGCRIPIVKLEALMADPPDDILILPWPRAAEIAVELSPLRQIGTQLWTAIPRIARA